MVKGLRNMENPEDREERGQKNPKTGIWKAEGHGNQLGGLKTTSKSTSQADGRKKKQQQLRTIQIYT